MRIGIPAAALTLIFVTTMAVKAQNGSDNSAAWSGVLINSACTVDEAFGESAKCTAEAPGAKLALYDDTIRQVYGLDPQSQVTAKLGDSVTVRGTLENRTIHIASVKMFADVGLGVGQNAPPISARDQFGREQTLETLKGAKGTVLLFYRSADWCPYCKGQLIQLQAAKARFEKQGIKLAGISYDSVEILTKVAKV